MMRELTARLAAEPGLLAGYQAAHQDYVATRGSVAEAAGVRPLPPGTASAGGMPDRIKCLHALVAHELARPGRTRLAARPYWRWVSGGRVARAC